MRAKLVYESLQFQRGSDPRQILNIGKRVQIEEWFRDIEKQFRRKIDYIIDDKLNIVVKHDLWLDDLNINWLPDNLTIKGDLDLRYTNITELPDNLTVDGNLWIRNTNITELPDSLKAAQIHISANKLSYIPLKLKQRISIR